jgi:hypothetical protein
MEGLGPQPLPLPSLGFPICRLSWAGLFIRGPYRHHFPTPYAPEQSGGFEACTENPPQNWALPRLKGLGFSWRFYLYRKHLFMAHR